ncbi:hypothetical protein OROMI_001276 [Orobanche minor]
MPESHKSSELAIWDAIPSDAASQPAALSLLNSPLLLIRNVYNASGVGEPLYRSRSQSRATNANKNSGSSSRLKRLIDEVEDVQCENKEEEIEFVGNKSLNSDSDDGLDYFGEEEYVDA